MRSLRTFFSHRRFSTSSDLNYLANRKAELANLEKTQNLQLYPSKIIKPTIEFDVFKSEFEHLKASEVCSTITHSMVGRIIQKREASTKLVFLSLRDSKNVNIQVMASMKNFESGFEIVGNLKRGDVIQVTGMPGKTKTGELSLIATSFTILSPCLHQIPLDLDDVEIRHRKRYLDLLVNPELKERFVMRSKIIQFTRSFLDKRGFLEVETPIISQEAGGANAKPFTTYSNALDMDLKLRVSPELFLKKLVAGGFDRVYEIGKVFRNEGVDITHNPEFTSCEFYQAYSNYEDLMKLTEEYLHDMCVFLHGKATIVVGEHTIDFTPPFKRVSFLSSIEENVKQSIPSESGPKALELLTKMCVDAGIKVDKTRESYPYLLDKLLGHFVESKCIQPTFICDHPIQLSPLARNHDGNKMITERFELFILQKEIANAYSELNDPREQKKRFDQQAKLRQSGDDEAMSIDDHFCEALEYGLPPTGGWGIGIDRLVMLMCNTWHIREVILFPLMKEK